jgi:hypothetical protein
MCATGRHLLFDLIVIFVQCGLLVEQRVYKNWTAESSEVVLILQQQNSHWITLPSGGVTAVDNVILYPN